MRLQKDFLADCYLIFDNAMLFNKITTDPAHDHAKKLKAFVDQQVAENASAFSSSAGASTGGVPSKQRSNAWHPAASEDLLPLSRYQQIELVREADALLQVRPWSHTLHLKWPCLLLHASFGLDNASLPLRCLNRIGALRPMKPTLSASGGS